MSETKTIEELVKKYHIKPNVITKEMAGEPLKYELLRSSDLKVDAEYQRLISKVTIEKCGHLRRDLLASILVSRRPESLGDWSGDFVFDGQHKTIMHYVSGIEEEGDDTTWLPCQVKVWPEEYTLDEIRKGEADLFIKHNTWRKNPTQVDKYRSEAFFGNEEALKIESVLKNLNLQIDGFGSSEDDAKKLKTPNPFFRCVLQDLEMKKFKTEAAQSHYTYFWMRAALKQYTITFPKDTVIHGQVLRTLLLAIMFAEEGLTNGTQRKFKKFLNESLLRYYNSTNLIKNYGGFSGPSYILHDRIINSYNTMEGNLVGQGAQTIGPETLLSASAIDKAFTHPDIS
jgi:hypothetical protein